MWGLTVRIEGDRVEHDVPAWLLGAAATYGTIGYVKQIAAELMRAPEGYAFDPSARYTAFIQTWDAAWHNMRSLAFGRRAVGESLVELMPDPYYIGHYGYHQLRHEAQRTPSWEMREPLVVWRGSVTGASASSIEEIPRIALALACRGIPGTDVRLFGVHSTMANAFSIDEIAEKLAYYRLEGDRWQMAQFANYRYVLDIDGHANAWAFLEKLILGCCVLKVGSVFEQWFYDRLQPWVHYVPVRGDLADLEEIVNWCYASDDRCAWIAGNAARAAASMRFEDELPHSCRALLSVSHLEVRWRTISSPIDRASLSILPFALADEVEAGLRFDAAIAELERLAAARQGGATTHRRLARLYQEQGDPARAMAALERAARIDPVDWQSGLDHARIASGLGQEVLATGLLRRLLDDVPDAIEARIALTAAFLRLDWVDVAWSTIELLPPGDSVWWKPVRDEALTRRAAYRREVIDALREARGGAGLTRDLCWILARRLAALGRLTTAARLCDALRAERPDDFAPVELIAKIVQRTTGTDAALAFLQELPRPLRIAEGYRLLLARMRAEAGSFELALEALDDPICSADAFDARLIRATALLALTRRDALQQHCARWMARSDEPHPTGLLISAQRSEPPQVPDGNVNLAVFAESELDLASWQRINPGLDVQRFDRGSALRYLGDTFDDQTVRAFEQCRHVEDRAVLFGLAFIVSEGGIWVDARERCLKPADVLFQASVNVNLAAVRSEDMIAYLHPIFLGGRRGSPDIASLLAQAVDGILEADRAGSLLESQRWLNQARLTRWIAERFAITEGPENFLFIPFRRYRDFVGRG